jgi:type I restriction enzyme M protein
MGSVKTQDIPTELRTWWKHFQVAAYRYDYIKVFDDFITMTLTQFACDTSDGFFKQWHTEAMKSYDRKEKDAFNAMFFEVVRIMDEHVGRGDRKWFDCFGTMYETLSGSYKKSSLGQFFTPESVVEMMCLMQLSDIKQGDKKRILDPCSGSGRMLFIAHAHAPGNYTYAIDIDQLCAKMSAINMMMHGCVGEVVCGNGLFLDQDWRWALSINPILTHHGIPSLMKIEKEQSWLWSSDQAGLLRPRIESTPDSIRVKKPKEKKPVSQLSIFNTQI